MQSLQERINKVAAHPDARVLIIGESGTGKETVANQIHTKSPRKREPYYAFNCASVNPELLASRFFGYEKGAFTGADRQTDGLFQMADGGTLFLDEIGELLPEAQALLLRVLEVRLRHSPFGVGDAAAGADAGRKRSQTRSRENGDQRSLQDLPGGLVTRFFRQFLRPNNSSRRIFSGLLSAILLFVLLFSSAFVTSEADHDCSGYDCPICLELQNCIANFQLLGSALGGEAVVPVSSETIGSDARVVCAYRAPSLTLQRLDVRFDE